MQPAGTRTRRGRANDERILDAAVSVAYEVGFDAFGLKDVAAAAGLTTGALYGRYDGVGELQAELWQQRLLPELKNWLSKVRSALDAGCGEASLAAALEPTTTLTVALFALAVAPRTDDLGDLVPDDLGGALAAERLLPTQASAFELGFLALALGLMLHEQREGRVSPGAAEVASVLERAPRTVRGAVPSPAPNSELQFQVPGDETRERLVNALARVVRRAGLHRATVRRIARAAGSSHTAVYGTYGSLQGLVEDFVNVVGNSRPAPAVMAERYLNLQLLASFMSSGVQPGARDLRRLSLEFLVGVSPNTELAKVVTDFDTDRYEEAAATFCRKGSRQYKAFINHARAVRAANFGFMLLQDAIGGCEEVDSRPVLAAFLREVTG